ncbi:GCN5 family acetyltransferase [Cryobacterium roopkundense]|uniref:GCN5 family acetyltransferase n=1 Tax=Cryobacterium roopkundense TaxID=1001240 RepID=A0A099J172_9MICO|nr:GNAT family N-acetyltransferase [Cryobacterium roopkundense]KGJ71910.1 GCN5 family acetyltransferase [Cryobacterium roopkundense]MBB5641768.1 RimJ/RimL family protein N-acetyltransferase [Cryobacterium roopkundense]
MLAIHTDRLLLRPFVGDDADFVFDVYSRWEVQRYIGAVPRVMASLSEAFDRIHAWQQLDDGVHGVWAVAEADSGKLLGTVLLKFIPASGSDLTVLPSGDTEIGWHFHPDAWGKGCASEAASAVLRHAFSQGLRRVVAVTNPLNLASQRVCERIGMSHEGLTDAYYNARCELFVGSAA